MKGRTTTPLRVLAMTIAAAGALDPAFALTRSVRPEVAIVAGPRLPDSALEDRVADTLSRSFSVVREPSFGPAAVVVVGDTLPPAERRAASVGFVVAPAARDPFVSIVALETPERATPHARIPVRVHVNARAANGRSVSVTIGTGAIAVDRVTRSVSGDDALEVIEAGLIAPGTGRVHFTVSAELAGSEHVVDGAVTVRPERWQVLAFDRRPSWLGSFVRQVLQQDPRVELSSRVVTSRSAASTTGDAPLTLSASPDLERFDAVVVGGLESLTAEDSAGLEAYLRRGGSVILLPDEPEPPAALRQLTGIANWSVKTLDKPAGSPPATEILTSPVVPPWARLIDDRVVAMSVGTGELLVNGGIDAWRYRQLESGSGFRDSIPGLVVTAAARSSLQREQRDSPAPDASVRRPVRDDRPILASWASAHGGRVISETDLDSLAGEMRSALEPPAERRVVHPMRSAWWMLPFGLALGAEWWIRRRTGLR